MSLTVADKTTDGNGVDSYNATSVYNGHTALQLRVLEPTNPTAGVPHRYLYVIPVEASSAGNAYGNGLDALRAANVHNVFNCTLVSPSFENDAVCLADHPSDASLRYESFMVEDLQPWAAANLAGGGEHWLVGFSRSGIGVLSLILRHPTVFDRAAAWDFPADIAWGDAGTWLTDNLGTQANYDNTYRLTAAMIEAHKAPFLAARRLWISGDNATGTAWSSLVEGFYADAQTSGIPIRMYRCLAASRAHAWDSGWLWGALVGLDEQSMVPTVIRADAFTAGADTPMDQWPSVGAPDWQYVPGYGSGSDLFVEAAGGHVFNATGSVNAIVKAIMAGVNDDAEIEGDCESPIANALVVPRVGNPDGGLDGYYTTCGDGNIYRYRDGGYGAIANIPPAGRPVAAGHYRTRAIGTNPVRFEWQYNDGIVYTLDDADADRVQTGVPGLWSYWNGSIDNVVIRTFAYPSGATWAAAENTAITAPAGSVRRLRFQLDAQGDPASQQFQLEGAPYGTEDWVKLNGQ